MSESDTLVKKRLQTSPLVRRSVLLLLFGSLLAIGILYAKENFFSVEYVPESRSASTRYIAQLAGSDHFDPGLTRDFGGIETDKREPEEGFETSVVPSDASPIYLPTPDAVRAIYMTQCVAGTPSFRDQLIKLVETTELNAIVIDVKDYSGGLGFRTEHPSLKPFVSTKCRANDMRQLVRRLNDKGIYTIARITVFQDPLYAQVRPDLAVQKESDKSIWSDHKGLHFIDVGAREFWDYTIEVAKETHKLGFDELNFDYIRYPSDGDMRDIFYPKTEAYLEENPEEGRPELLREFFRYLHAEMEKEGIITSADLFGMVTTNRDDLGIGQILEYAEPYFDYIAPMVYPSHYPAGFNGWSNPNQHVYDLIKFTMESGVARLLAAGADPQKLRPWLQDFNYGGTYGPEEIQAQIDATYDAGLTSWMFWDPANRYTSTREALKDTE